MTVVTIRDVEVYIDGLCVGNADEATMREGNDISISGLNVKHEAVAVFMKILCDDEVRAIIRYKDKGKKHKISATARQINLLANEYGVSADIDFAI
jgi:hypothetical protein